MTVDVEDYFQVSAFEEQVGTESWNKWPLRVARNTDELLQLFADHNTKATFFMLGWVAEKEPGVVQRIVGEGHELASHGWSHRRVGSQNPDTFRDDVRRTRDFLQNAGGCPVIGYRAASYSVSLETLWALDVLADEGYLYSSSICPIKHDHYGIPGYPRFAFRLNQTGILEIPVTTIAIGKKNIPCGGGGWFRLAPYHFTQWALRKINQQEKQPAVFYLHPWEIDVDQPRVPGISFRSRFRHYLNLRHTKSRLALLLRDFDWNRMDKVFQVDSGIKNDHRCAG
ncbi:MAG: DUF3473 domain-containing protein [Gammaproteobacteria bacterium]|nr:DUF3473 domain-containing protein [Gammaproteobacteria bacterium]